MDEQRYIETQFEWVKAELTRLRQAVERLAETAITEKHFDRVVARVDALEDDSNILTRRVDDVENDVSLVKRVGAYTLSIIGALVVAWLVQVLGLR